MSKLNFKRIVNGSVEQTLHCDNFKKESEKNTFITNGNETEEKKK